MDDGNGTLTEVNLDASGATLARLARTISHSRSRRVVGVVQPLSVAEAREALLACSRARIPVWPVCSGRNWGLGSSLPVRDGAVVLDLSKLDRIVTIDSQRGVAVIEPGVSQERLANELKGLPWFLNVTGAPGCTSIIGNALDRGVGFYGQRHRDVLAMELMLSDGSVVRSGGQCPLSREFLDGAGFILAPGPDLSSLFFQSNFAVVLKAAISLRALQEQTIVLRVSFGAPALPSVLEALRKAYLQGLISSSTRIYDLSGVELYHGEAGEGIDHVAYLAIAGPVELAGTMLKHLVTSLLTPAGCRVEVLDASRDGMSTLDIVAFRCLHGDPSRNEQVVREGFEASPENLDADSTTGWLLVLSIVPFELDAVRDCMAATKALLASEAPQSHVTLNLLDARTVDCVIGVRFTRNEEGATMAHRLAARLRDEHRRLGFYPYRVDIDAMDWLREQEVRENPEYSELRSRIKRAFDPAGVIAPGRYVDNVTIRELTAEEVTKHYLPLRLRVLHEELGWSRLENPGPESFRDSYDATSFQVGCFDGERFAGALRLIVRPSVSELPSGRYLPQAAVYAGRAAELSRGLMEPGYRGRKLFPLLVEACLDHAKRENVDHLIVSSPTDPAIHGFYRRFGLECTGVRFRYADEAIDAPGLSMVLHSRLRG